MRVRRNGFPMAVLVAACVAWAGVASAKHHEGALSPCTNPPVSDDTPCDDGNPATIKDRCSAGLCIGLDLCAGVICATSDTCQEPGTCDPLTGGCNFSPRPDGSVCDDGNAATTEDACRAGICLGALPCSEATASCTACLVVSDCPSGDTCVSGVCHAMARVPAISPGAGALLGLALCCLGAAHLQRPRR